VLLACALSVVPQSARLVLAQDGNGTPVIDPEALAALDKMGAYLRTLNTFEVRAAYTRERVLQDGQKVQRAGTADLIATRPSKLRVSVTADASERQFYFDGKWFTLFAPREKFYATVSAPATINDLSKQLEDKYDIELPLVDLFRWGTPDGSTEPITSALDFGISLVNGTTCQHYAFRQEGLDWQVWIQKGEFPLPLKVVLTTTTDDARPQMASVYTWNLAPSVSEASFTFVPPTDARRIPLTEVTPVSGVTRK
jgi:hypothetical protein